MGEQDILNLIQAELDGQLDAQQRAELAQRVLADPEARALREELQHLRSMLDELEKVEPPPELKASVLDSLPVAAAPRSASPWLSAHWRYAALIAGVLAGATVVYETVDGPGPGSSELAGTMAARQAAQTLDAVELRGGVVSGTLRLYRDPGGLALAFEVTSSEPVDATVATGGRTLQVPGLAAPGMAGEPRRIALPGSGERQLVEVTFVSAGREVARATLTSPEGR
jgi:hypothetical protein